MVDEQSACLQGVPRQGLPSDHFQLNRFDGPEDPSYVAVRDEIVRMYRERVMEVQRTADRKANDPYNRSFPMLTSIQQQPQEDVS